MKSFLQKHASSVIGVLSGFDRLVFRGTLRGISYPEGMAKYLSAMRVLLKDFGTHAGQVTKRVKDASLALAIELDRPVKYLASPSVKKEAVARSILEENPVDKGLVCVLESVEPCRTFDIYKNREAKKLELVSRTRKCKFLYHYVIHPVFGFMNARIQSWYPFPVQVCINGREWLARQMDFKGFDYIRRDNCFTWLEDPAKAQKLLDAQLRASWSSLLDGVARHLNPAHDEIFRDYPIRYYWSAYQSEWASDVMFRNPQDLRRLYPSFVHHGITTFGSPDVMRFLGRRIPRTGRVHGRFEGEVVSDVKFREEGVRIKHRVNGNSIKAYDKAYDEEGAVFRIECTINDPKDFKVWRKKEGEKEGGKSWRPLRKGIADLHRRSKVSQACNNRYLDALSSIEGGTPLREIAADICRPLRWKGRPVRAINPFSPEDSLLLAAVTRCEFTINGFRNRDIRRFLYRSLPSSPHDETRRSRSVTRKLRLLRAHSLIKKVPSTHRYVLTEKGRKAATAMLAAAEADVSLLTKVA